MKTAILLIIFSFSTMWAGAQDSPEKTIEKFFLDYQQGAPAKALDNLYTHMPWADRIKDNLDNLKTQFVGLQTLVGKYYGYGLITKKELAGSFVYFSYLVKYDRQPVRFTFEFYKPQDKWFLYAFSYDDKLDEEIEEAAKLYNLK